MEKTWKPTVAGVFGLIGGLALVVLGSTGDGFLNYLGFEVPQLGPLAFLLVTGIPSLVLGILALAGGIYALRRKMWVWHLLAPSLQSSSHIFWDTSNHIRSTI